MRLMLVLLGLLILAPDAAAEKWRWPWDAPHQRHRFHRKAVKPAPPPDCKRINEAVKFLSKDDLEKELAALDQRRRRIIAKCREHVE